MYLLILALLFVLELIYFRIALRFIIIDKPNERSSHKKIVLRGGGIIFTIALWIWSIMYGFQYPWMLAGVTLVAAVSFADDICRLNFFFRLAVQFVSMLLVFQDLGLLHWHLWLIVLVALVVAVGGSNIFNFMDGINGITGGYSLAMLIPLYLLNQKYHFVDEHLIVVIGLSALVFCFFNYRTKAKCFAGDVGSIGMALMIVFCLGRLMLQTGDITWLVLYLVYGVDGCLTIAHRAMLHENLGVAHRKHAYQLMANELKIPHVVVSTIYTMLQLAISLVAIFVIPDHPTAHWIYLMTLILVLGLLYIGFMKKYYHLHEEYLRSLQSDQKS